MDSAPNRVVAELASAFDALGIRYVVGGSLASSMYGVPRATQDVDLVAVISPTKVDALAALLTDRFHLNVDSMREAVTRRTSFNVIHLQTLFKADVFVPEQSEWSLSEQDRARLEELPAPQGPVTVRFASPEDTLLHKLVWYRLGGETSDRQWGDIRGILQVQGERLDSTYLKQWARHLDVEALLARALVP